MSRAVGSADAAARLRARGMRWTPQREQVLDAVRRLGHGTPEQIAAATADVDLATVYRTLDVLEDVGLLAHTHLGHGAPSYGVAEEQHIHVVCHICGTVIDPPADLANELVARLASERDFVVDLSHLTVFGACADCANERRSVGGNSRHSHDAASAGAGAPAHPAGDSSHAATSRHASDSSDGTAT